MKGEDRLSNLPKELRNHIFSFLPMKDAVRTSILSRQWRNIVPSLSNLNFECPHYPENTAEELDIFIDFVDRILHLIPDMSELQNLRFALRGYPYIVHNTQSNLWISYSVIHKVKVLHLDLFMDEPHRLPRCLFSSTSLTVLKLRLNETFLKLPKNIHLPNLKTLELTYVAFLDDNLTGKLLSNCPELEQLDIDCCTLDNIKILYISPRKLKEFTLKSCYNSTNCKIKVCCPTLQHIAICGDIGEDYEFENLSSLRSGKVLVESRSFAILKGLYNVTDLEISNWYIEFLSMAPNLSTCLPTSFKNLKTLNLSMWPTECHVHVIILLITISPNLEYLSMKVMSTEDLEPLNMLIPETESVNLSVEGMLGHLKKVIINYSEGSESELKLVKFVLENAKELNELRISYYKEIGLERRMEMSEKLNTFIRSSSIAKVLLTLN